MVTDPEVNVILEKFYDFLNMASATLTRTQMKIVLKEMFLKLDEMNQLEQNFLIPVVSENLEIEGFVLNAENSKSSDELQRTDVTVEDINEVDVQEVDEVELIEEDEESALEIKNQDQIVEEEKTNLFFFLDENNETISSDQIIQDSSENLKVEEMVEDVINPLENDGDDKNGILEVWSEEILTEPDSEPVSPGLDSSPTDILITTHDSSNPLCCCLCDKSFKSVSAVEHHLLIKHKDERGEVRTKIYCGEDGCNYSTFSQNLLKAHIYSHANNAPLTCPVCKKDYLGGPKALKQHMKIHESTRNYFCDRCNKTFINQSRLTHHIQNVHSNSNFHCDQCSKIFKSKANFHRHMRIHTNEKPFSCPYCGFSSNHSANLTSHVRSVHKQTNFTTGKEEKSRKKANLLKNIIENKSSRLITSLLGELPVNEQNVSQSLGENLFRKLTDAGEIQTINIPQPEQNLKPNPNSLIKVKTAIPDFCLKSSKTDKIITVTNSQGQLVNAVVKLKRSRAGGDQILHVCVKD